MSCVLEVTNESERCWETIPIQQRAFSFPSPILTHQTPLTTCTLPHPYISTSCDKQNNFLQLKNEVQKDKIKGRGKMENRGEKGKQKVFNPSARINNMFPNLFILHHFSWESTCRERQWHSGRWRYKQDYLKSYLRTLLKPWLIKLTGPAP